MGRFEQRSEKSHKKGDPLGDADSALRIVTEELQIIQRTLLKSLQEDVKRLQGEKTRLTDDIQRLQTEKDDLQRGRQINEQQVLVRQLGQVLANHISSQLNNSLEKLANQGTISTPEKNEPSQLPHQQENIEKIIGSLDNTLTITIRSLQQELKNYQNSLSQQLSRMQNQQQQGELILVELVNRLRKELEKNALASDTSIFTEIQSPPSLGGSPTVIQPDLPLGGIPTVIQTDELPLTPTTETPPQTPSNPSLGGIPTVIQTDETPPTSTTETPPQTPSNPSLGDIPTVIQTDETPPTSISTDHWSSQTVTPESTSLPKSNNQESDSSSITPPTIPPHPATASPPGFSQIMASLWQKPQGLFLILLSTLVSALYNVAIRVMFQPVSQIFGVFEVEQLISPTLGNSLLILMLRMLVVMPLILVLAPILYPRVWRDLQNLVDSFKSNSNNNNGKKTLVLSILSGCFLFLSQVLIYIAIGQVSVGMAIALFFIYPTISSLLSWFLFRDFPTPFRAITISTIFLGELLVLAGVATTDTGDLFLGSISAITAGIMFAFYVVLTRICASKIHPVAFTLVNFATILLFCFIGLMVLPFFPINSLSLQINTNKILEIILTAFILGMLTLCGYLFNNFGIRKLGASRSALIGATVPAITVIFAGLIIQESLQPLQILGILLLTFGAAAVSFEKIRTHQVKSSQI
ncbi:EamA family transporter [Calothrix rhizosoleniae]|uniref:EamA family transporter n=1 Tax=Calothrix rhizosoleniae TaxID=888997 RepID=UPI000B499A30|nr:EamA family transporter [Calothrix rhizosoleniae]